MAGEAFEERFVEADGFRIRYVEAGKGPLLICLHGGGGLRLAPAHDILAKNHRVIAFEMPGFGASPENRRSASTEDLGRSMNAAVAALGLDRYCIMGTSFGSKVALWMAIERPEAVESIVLISPAAIREQQGPVPTHVAPEEAAKLLYAHPERQPKSAPPPRELVAKQSCDLTGRRRTRALHERARRHTHGDCGGVARRRLARVGDGQVEGQTQMSDERLSARRPASRPRCLPRVHAPSHLCDWPMVRPKLISPLSMRMLNPHSGLLHTQALNVMGAPSRP